MPGILKHYPKLKLYVVGQTHPGILAYSGEKYRESLVGLAKELGVHKNVAFVNRYLPVDELVEYLQAADIYLTLHGDPEQAASGTLAYAMGAGLVAISTPYRYAQEVLDEGRGFLVPFGDS
jgi:glycosyltransferase involved in cell wall biosynthesis